jgi:starch phosphorylase
VREYAEQHYIPAAAAYRERAADKGRVGGQVAEWQEQIGRHWGSLRFGTFRVESCADSHRFEVEVFLNGLDPNSLGIQLYADGIGGGTPAREEMKRAEALPDASGRCLYHATVTTPRSPGDFTARATPRRSGVAVPLEAGQILWQR